VPRSLAVVALALSVAGACAGTELPGWRASWVRVSTANFELYTTADENAGRSLIVRLEKLRAALQPILDWRGELPDEHPKPICIIEFASREEFLPYAPMNRSIGFFLPGVHRDFVVLDGTHAEGRSAAHEYVHFVIAQSGLRLPTWLNEGLAELYSNLDESAEIGQFIPGRVLSLHRDSWIALDELTSADAGSDLFTGAASVDSAYAESWLLAHMLVLDPRYSAKFPDLLTALQTTDTPDAFCRVYGQSIAQVEQALKEYVEVGQGNVRVARQPAGTSAPELSVEKDADFEGLTALAEMLANYRGRTEQSRDLYQLLGTLSR
jgi:hypothetical protein